MIESDIDNVKIQIVSDGKPVSGLSINHGATATKLRADKYEITIEGSTDGLTIENNQFTLKQGETVVARIRMQKPVAGLASPPLDVAGLPIASPEMSEPLYEGKTLSEWLEMLARERSAAGLKSAFDACDALATPATSEKITKTILQVVPDLDGDTDLGSSRFSSSTSIDQMAAAVLREANPGAFYRLWVREFEAADEAWRERLWSYVRLYDETAEAIEPFIVWAEKRLMQPRTGNPSVDADTVKAADFVRGQTQRYQAVDDHSFVARIAKALKSSPHLGPGWWLNQPLVYRSNDSRTQSVVDTNLWPAAIKSEITRIAVDVLDDAQSNKQLITHACLILADGAEVDPAQRTKVLADVDRRLVELSADPAAMKEIITLESNFRDLTFPEFTAPRFRIGTESGTYLVFALLGVAKAHNGGESIPEGLKSLLVYAQPVRQIVAEQEKLQAPRQSRGRPSPLSFITLNWPDLTASRTGSGGSAQYAAQGVRELWGPDEPTTDDWLMYCLLQHPVMQPYLAEVDSPADAESAPAAPIATPPKNP